MLSLPILKLKVKQQGIFTPLFGGNVVVENNRLGSAEAVESKKIIKWENAFRPLQVAYSPHPIKIEFVFKHGGSIFGNCKSALTHQIDKKDCIDVINKNFKAVGKFIFFCQWHNGQPAYNLANSYNPPTQSLYNQSNLQFNSNAATTQMRPNRIKTNRVIEEDKGFFSFLGCVTAPRKKALDPFTQRVYEYDRDEIKSNGGECGLSLIPVTYYSKKYYKP